MPEPRIPAKCPFAPRPPTLHMRASTHTISHGLGRQRFDISARICVFLSGPSVADSAINLAVSPCHMAKLITSRHKGPPAPQAGSQLAQRGAICHDAARPGCCTLSPSSQCRTSSGRSPHSLRPHLTAAWRRQSPSGDTGGVYVRSGHAPSGPTEGTESVC